MRADQDQLRASIIAAVQAELDRHATTVLSETAKLRADALKERESMRASFGEQLASLAAALEQSHARNEKLQRALSDLVDTKLAESESRSTRRLEEITSNIDSLVEGVTRPLLQAVRDDQASLGRRVDAVDTNLRKFDEQAARMVSYFSDTTQAVEKRTNELADHLNTGVDRRIAELIARIEDGEANAVRHRTEISQSVTQRTADIEDRINQRMLAAETRIKDDAGAKIADIDAHLGKVSKGLDDTLSVVNDRMTGLDGRLDGFEAKVDEVRAELASVDTDAIEELKQKMSAAAGEAMLVRIEVERLEKTTGERLDSMNVRVTDVESQLADQTLDVGTAVQLERLEELERAMIELDPARFVTKDEWQQSTGSNGANGSNESNGSDAEPAHNPLVPSGPAYEERGISDAFLAPAPSSEAPVSFDPPVPVD